MALRTRAKVTSLKDHYDSEPVSQMCDRTSLYLHPHHVPGRKPGSAYIALDHLSGASGLSPQGSCESSVSSPSNWSLSCTGSSYGDLVRRSTSLLISTESQAHFADSPSVRL